MVDTFMPDPFATSRSLKKLQTVEWTLCPFAVAIVLLSINSPSVLAQDSAADFFEKSVRPILVARCIECHNADDASGGLRLDSAAGLQAGGESGAAFTPGDTKSSRLLRAIRREGDLAMPPDNPLSDLEVAALTHWIAEGAHWPEENIPLRTAAESAAESHWAFQPVIKPEVPNLSDNWVRNPIDAFVLEKLTAAGLKPSPPADPRTLVRRTSYTLTGLPPEAETVEQFAAAPSPAAYGQLIERWLASPHYGEHWARHWLDVARYSDTKGYVYAREERFWIHAWSYRDWVVQAFNEDLPYDRFLMLQIAADQVPDRRPVDLAAMGFLTLGRRFLGVEREIIDDRIDVVCRGTLGLTVGCARCHNHKYDPIPTADYYSLYGVFDSCREEVVRLDTGATDDAFEAGLAERIETLENARSAARAEASDRVRDRIRDYLVAQTELEKYPPKGFDQIFGKNDILPAFVRRWESYLRAAKRSNDPVFVAWHAYQAIDADAFAEESPRLTAELQRNGRAINPHVADLFIDPPRSFAEVIDRYAALLTRVRDQWRDQLASAQSAGVAVPGGFEDPALEQLRGVLYGPSAPCEVPDESIVHIESHVDSGTCTDLWKKQGEVDRWILKSAHSPRYAVALVDREEPTEPRIFRRGNPATPGKDVPRQFLSLLTGPDRAPFSTGSGRRELAEAIVAPDNPLTARVLVNRVWAYHFGQGLVTTPSDFGTRATPPSHPALLDWLAARFIDEGWSIKDLHRLILQSATYQQSSSGPADTQRLRVAQRQDPETRLLWRMPVRRLSFEELRDSLYVAGEDLDVTMDGPPAELFTQPYPTRRTLYGLVDRQFFPSALRTFDFANPDLHIPKRPETTVPQQALFLMNHPLVVERAKAAAVSIDQKAALESQIGQLYRRIFQREPNISEAKAARTFLASSSHSNSPPRRATIDDWTYGYGAYDEPAQRVSTWTPLPHFTGNAWQGGPKWPDATLGWVQLTATGGHPGNNRNHAAIRRWTAPRTMTVTLVSSLKHEAAPGDGIRAFIVHSGRGLIDSTSIHQATWERTFETIDVAAGETIDFIVDIGDVLNSDQYLWAVTIKADEPTAGSSIEWDSTADFPPNEQQQLTPLAQLAQVLMCSNEFFFVD